MCRRETGDGGALFGKQCKQTCLLVLLSSLLAFATHIFLYSIDALNKIDESSANAGYDNAVEVCDHRIIIEPHFFRGMLQKMLQWVCKIQ
jgi:hypothetical protein